MKHSLLTIIFFVFVLSISAQDQLGFKVNYLIPNYRITATPPNSDETMDEDNGLSYVLNYKHRWPGMFNVGGGLEYYRIASTFNSKYTSLGADVFKDVDYVTNYLSLRLIPEFGFGEKLRAYVQVGPFIGVLLASSAEGIQILTDGKDSVTYEIDESAYDDFPGLDWGFFIGAGAEYPLSDNFKIAIELQYSRGFANFYRDDEYVFATRNFTTGLSLIYVLKGYSERIKDED
jgi:opacity protein-like surface antigen